MAEHGDDEIETQQEPFTEQIHRDDSEKKVKYDDDDVKKETVTKSKRKRLFDREKPVPEVFGGGKYERDDDDDPTSIFLPNLEASFFEDQQTPSRFRASTRHINTTVWNQQNEGICLAVSSTDVTTTILRMTGPDKKLLLSPQSLADYCCKKFLRVRYFLTSKKFGIEKLTDQPFHLTKRLRSHYHPYGQRFTMDRAKILRKPGNIRMAIVDNFGPFGSHYPMVGSCKMGDLAESKVAAGCFNLVPFSHNYKLEGCLEKLRAEGSHAVTISGCNTESKDPEEHFVEIKNSWGRNWGVGGYTNVCFCFIRRILSFNYKRV